MTEPSSSATLAPAKKQQEYKLSSHTDAVLVLCVSTLKSLYMCTCTPVGTYNNSQFPCILLKGQTTAVIGWSLCPDISYCSSLVELPGAISCHRHTSNCKVVISLHTCTRTCRYRHMSNHQSGFPLR